MTRQAFKTVDVLRVDVENTPTGLRNLVVNPDGEYGGYGWITPVAGSRMERDVTTPATPFLRYVAAAGVANEFRTEPLPIAAGQYAAANLAVGSIGVPPFSSSADLGYHNLRFVWLDADGDTISSTTATGLSYITPKLAPAGTAFVQLRVDVFSDEDGAILPAGFVALFRNVMVATAATSTPLNGLIYTPPATYTNVLGSSIELGLERDELDAATLTATILNATLDPALSTLIRPGKRVRLVATTTGVDVVLWSGKVTNGKVTYDPGNRVASKRARIALTATDAIDGLGQPRAEGVATIDELPYVLEGCGVPWSVNGSGNQVSTATVAAVNDSASALDQVVLTRDSVLGYAWVDRRGILQVWDRDEIPATSLATLDETVYSSPAIDYDTDRCINHVTVVFLRYDAAAGTTEEITYGPYRDEVSIAQWGEHRKEFKIQWGAENEVAIEALAATILGANATPVVRVNEVTIPLLTSSAVTAHAARDLYDLVTVVNTGAGISDEYRVTSIKHTITTDQWLLTLGFAVEGGVASPTYVPSPTGAADGLTFAQTIRPVGEVTMWYGAKADCPAGWLVCDGSAFSATDYPRLHALFGSTNLPNFTDRMPIGAGTKALGTSGGAATVALTKAHLPDSIDLLATGSAGGGTTENSGASIAQGATSGRFLHPVNTRASGSQTALDVTGPWRALWFIIRAV